MDISYVRHRDIDKARWDDLIEASPMGRVYAFSWYLDAMANRWGALIGGDYEFVMPVPYSLKYGVARVLTPPFIQQLGVFGRCIPDTELIERFLCAIPSRFRRVDLSVCGEPDLSSFSVVKRTNLILNINRPYEQIAGEYRSDARKKLRDKNNFIYQEEIETEKVLADYQAYNNISAFNLKASVFNRLLLAAESARSRGNLVSSAIKESSGNVLASGLFFVSHGRSYYVAGSQSERGKACHASHLLIDGFIQQHACRLKIFDFEGSDIPGVADFFRKWGSVPEYYSRIVISRFPFNLKIVSGLRR